MRRRAPVADVVFPDDLVALELQQPDKAVSDDGGPQVADVHLLGGIGRGIIDYDSQRAGRPGDAHVCGARNHISQLAARKSAERTRLIKPGPATSAPSHMASKPAARLGPICPRRPPGRPPERPGQAQGAVHLEVGPLRRAQPALRPGLKLLENRGQDGIDRCEETRHPFIVASGRARGQPGWPWPLTCPGSPWLPPAPMAPCAGLFSRRPGPGGHAGPSVGQLAGERR